MKFFRTFMSVNIINVFLLLSNLSFLTCRSASKRSAIESFKVMDVMARALELETEGMSVCHMEVGQPSSGAPSAVLESAKSSLLNDKIGYTNAVGIEKLRTAISKHYKDKYNVDVPIQRIVVTTGSSAAFLFAFLGCFDVGDCVALCGTGYPCYRNILNALGIEISSIPANMNFKLTSKELLAEINSRKQLGLKPIQGLILSSPSNPTGAMFSSEELSELCSTCDENNIVFISDEIYHGISYGKQKEETAIKFSDSSIIINSFSKYYSMTGWRLGWMVVPDYLIDTMTRLSQNMYINAPTLSQLAACEAFNCIDELEEHLKKYRRNRDIVLSTLDSIGLSEGISPADGAFYIYVDLSHHGIDNTPDLCKRILEEAGVAITPGVDFEDPASGLGLKRMRFSYSRNTDEVEEGMKRFKKWWEENFPKQ